MRRIKPESAYPDGISNLMILAARDDLEMIRSFPLNERLMRQSDQWGYTALDYAQPASRLYLNSFIQSIRMPFGREQANVSFPLEVICYESENREAFRCPNALGPLNCWEMTKRARWRGISEEQPAEQICRAINSWSPPPEWLEASAAFFSALSKADQELINRYVSGSYAEMNSQLRKNPDGPAPINSILRRMTPLPHDILVFRGFADKEGYPDQGLYVHRGYLSTTLNEDFPPFLGYRRILRLIVPAGTPALHIDSSEWEILLPHNSPIHILTHRSLEISAQDPVFQEVAEKFEWEKQTSIFLEIYDGLLQPSPALN